MHMGCGRVHGDRTPPTSHGDLRKVYCDERVIKKHGKLQLAYSLLPGKWLNGMTYIGATPALHLGAEGAGYLQDLVVCPRFENAHGVTIAGSRGWLHVVCAASLGCLGCPESHLSFVFGELSNNPFQLEQSGHIPLTSRVSCTTKGTAWLTSSSNYQRMQLVICKLYTYVRCCVSPLE